MAYFEQREYKRYIFNQPIQGFIQPIMSYTNNTKKPIWILDMSGGGLKFASDFEFMANYIDIYKIQTILLSKELMFFGHIIRRKKLIHDQFEYSVKFSSDYHQPFTKIVKKEKNF